FAREELHAEFNWAVAGGSLLLAVLGISTALVVYAFGARWQVSVGPLQPLYKLIARRYFLDDLYEKVIAGGIVYGLLGGLGRLLDTRLIDGIVNGAGWATRRIGAGLNRLQSGQQQGYAFVFLGGVVVIAAIMFVVAL
ncbi:MAG: hypothetical protein ACRDJ9_20145, partial [Dehalococcoidia bacterium]